MNLARSLGQWAEPRRMIRTATMLTGCTVYAREDLQVHSGLVPD